MTDAREDRRRVQTALNVNMVVEAGAGTGKTTLLIDRLCFALLAQNVAPERMVALTFTEKAAAEIKTRLLFKLQSVVTHAQDPQADRTVEALGTHFGLSASEFAPRAEQALLQLDRAHIGTIHGFCADILKMFPLEAGLTPNAEIDKGAKAERLFDAEWNRFLDVELGADAPRAALWKEVLRRVNLPEVKSTVRELCGGKIEAYDYFSHKDFLAALCLQKADEAEALSTAFLNGKKPRNIEKALTRAAQTFRACARFLQTGETPAPSQEEPPAIGSAVVAGWEPDEFERAKELCDFAQKADPQKQDLVLKIYQLTGGLVDKIRRRYGQEGILSFDDLIVKTRNLLQQNLAVRNALKAAYDLLFIDEFQDTDPVQGELLLFLAEEKDGAATDWRSVRLQKGKLFVVGDPKQSIYRFRGADITAYELFTRLILEQGGEKNFLRRNFRSELEIIQTANAVTGAVMREVPAFQPAYEPIYTEKTALGGAAELALVYAGDDAHPSADDYRHNQAQFIARWINENVGKLTLANGRKLAYGDVALLTRAATTAGPYVDALRRNAVPFAVEEDKNFYRNQEINDFLNLLRVLDDKEDKIALAGVLRSPLGGFTDEELYQIARRGELSRQARTADERLAAFYRLLNELAAKAGRVPLKELLDETLRQTFLAEACAAAYEGEQSAANIYKLISLAVGYALETPSTLGQFLSRVQTLMEDELARLSATLSDGALSAVSVMTVHKSKGLEFPVVILADISKKDGSSSAGKDAHIYSWAHGMHGLRVGGLADLNLAFLEEEQKKHGKCEEVRVAYVALTRAREKLLLVGNCTEDGKTVAEMFARAGLFPDPQERPETVCAGECRVGVTYIPFVEPSEFLYAHAAQTAVCERPADAAVWRAAYDERMAAYERFNAQKTFVSPSRLTQEEPQDEAFETPSEAAQLGSVCHKALEGLLAGGKTLEESVERAARRERAEPGVAQEALEILRPFTQSAVFDELRSGRVLAAEMPFTLAEKDGAWLSGVIDLVWRAPDGTVWVLDYKTDRVEPGLLAEAAEKYRPQTQAYLRAAQTLFAGSKLKSAVIFLREKAKMDL